MAERRRLLRLLTHAGRPLTVALFGLQVARALLPVTQAVAVGVLVARPGVATVALVAGLFLADQVVWSFLVPTRELIAKRVDGALRAGLRRVATGLPGLAELESRGFQDRAARVVDAGIGIARERSAGNAATGQVELMFRLLGAVAAAVLLATFSVGLAAALLAVSLVARAVLRRQWLAMIAVLDDDTASQRAEYYVAEQAVIGAAKDVRLFGLAEWFTGRFRAAAYRAYAPAWRRILVALRRQWWFVLLGVVCGAAALGVPAAAVFAGTLDPAQLITFALAGLGVLSISALGMEAFDIEYGLRGVAAYDELPGIRVVERRAAGRAPEIRFENVVFCYPGSDRPVLDGFDLTLRPGETVAVVGANGVGKTTFVKLLGGLYRPTSGRILIDGADASTVDTRTWLSVLFQDFVHYPADLRSNVAPGAPRDDATIAEALRQAGAEALLARGLDTSLWSEGTGGTDLSGGQWQRVALARALHAVATGRRVLVLDEPTAHLDVRAEAEFHERVVSRVRDVTTVLISHRLSTVRPAGRIVLVRDGRVAEDGTHDELMALGGDYHRFFTVQAEAFGKPA